MSTVMSYSAVRFKFKPKFNSVHEMYEFITYYLGEPNCVDYVSEWNNDENTYIPTEEVEYFSYFETKGSYVTVYDYNTGDWYLDYMLEDSVESCDDMNVSVSFDELANIRNKTFEKFKGCLEEDCKLKIFEWYTGCDMPIDF